MKQNEGRDAKSVCISQFHPLRSAGLESELRNQDNRCRTLLDPLSETSADASLIPRLIAGIAPHRYFQILKQRLYSTLKQTCFESIFT